VLVEEAGQVDRQPEAALAGRLMEWVLADRLEEAVLADRRLVVEGRADRLRVVEERADRLEEAVLADRRQAVEERADRRLVVEGRADRLQVVEGRPGMGAVLPRQVDRTNLKELQEHLGSHREQRKPIQPLKIN
jgi:hypothetical protein